jgi:Mor family transcriptional regulator
MKHLKTANTSLTINRSFDGDDHLSLQKHYNSSSTSLNNVTSSNNHDFELRKRDTLNG